MWRAYVNRKKKGGEPRLGKDHRGGRAILSVGGQT